MVFIVTEELTSKVLRIMKLSRLMLNCDQSNTKRLAPIRSNAAANLFAAQPVRSQLRQKIAGNSGSTGLPGVLCSIEYGPYPLRT